MNSIQLACRVYYINPEARQDILYLLLNSKENTPHSYGQYITKEGHTDDLSLEIKNRTPNSYGHSIDLWIDHVKTISDREEGPRPVRYYGEYEIQVISKKQNFNDHIIIYGPKNIDAKIKKALNNYVHESDSDKTANLRLLRVEFTKPNIDLIMENYPDLQHFCTENNQEDRIKGVVVKGIQLEQTDAFERFVTNRETSGSINFLGITMDDNKLIYVGGDGSIYSRYSFRGEEKIKIIYNLYSNFKRLNLLVNSLDGYG